MNMFDPSDTQKTSLQLRFDADGTVWIHNVASADLTALTPYQIQLDEYGWFSEALADGTETCFIGIPITTITSGDTCWSQVGGYRASIITANITTVVGQSVKIFDGDVAAGGSDFSGADGEFGAATEASTGTTHNLMLYPYRILCTT